MRNKNEIEEIENTEEMQNITVQLLNIAGDVKKIRRCQIYKNKKQKIQFNNNERLFANYR